MANIIIVSVLVKAQGFYGIAVASSITIAICAVLNYLLISKDGALFNARDFIDIAKSVAAMAFMSVCVYFANTHLNINLDILRVGLVGGVGIAVYGVLLILLLPSEIRAFLRRNK